MARKTLEYIFSMESGSLIGFSNHLKDYQMAYYINKFFKMNFSREKDFQRSIPNAKKKQFIQPSFYSQSEDSFYLYPFYSYFDERHHLIYLLLGAYSEGVFLHDVFKTFDKLIFVFGRDHFEAAQNLYEKHTQIPSTLAARFFDFSSVKSAAPKEEESIYIKGKEIQLSIFEEAKPLSPKNPQLSVTKEEKLLLKTYKFLNNELLHEIEMFFNQNSDENDAQNSIIF